MVYQIVTLALIRCKGDVFIWVYLNPLKHKGYGRYYKTFVLHATADRIY